MRNDSYPYYALACFHRSAFAFSALIILLAFSASFAYAAGPVSTEVAAGTTTYKVTQRTIATPSSVAVSAAKDITPYVKPTVTKLPAVGSQVGGLAQAAKGDLIIGLKDNSPVRSSFTGKFNVSGATLKTGAKALLRAAPAIQVGSMGLQALLDTADWTFGDHGELLKPSTGGDPTDPSYWGAAPEGVTYDSRNLTGTTSMMAALQDNVTNSSYAQGRNGTLVGAVNNIQGCLEELRNQCTIKPLAIDSEGRPISVAYYRNVVVNNSLSSIQCPTGTTYNSIRYGCVSDSQADFEPVTEAEIDAVVDSKYDPDPTDWDDVFPYIQPDSFLVDPIPSIAQKPSTTTSVDDLTGDTTVVEEKTSYDFGLSSNPSSQPSVSVKKRTETKTYKNGSLVGSGSVETEYPSENPDIKPLPAPSGGAAGGDGGTGFEFPAFCTWASPVCDFIDWFQEEPEEPEDDLKQLLNEVSIDAQSFTFSAPDAACPAPLVLELSQFGSREVSYQPLCDLASTMKSLYLSLMAFAAAVLLHRSISRD